MGKRATTLGIALLLCASACSREGPAKSSLGVQNVILVSIDSLRADHLGIYGYAPPTSPTIDLLGARGLVFDRAYSTTSWTLPSHAALLTGLDDYTHGVLDSENRLAEGALTLAEALRRSGVRSVGFFSGPYLHPSFGLAQGFDEYIDCTSYAWSGKGVLVPHGKSHGDVTNPIIREKLVRWSGEADARARHFIFIHMWDVHFDYMAPREYVDLFDPGYEGSMSGRDFQKNHAIRPGLPPRDFAHLLAQYDAEIRFTDETLGGILETFRDAGLLEGSAVIVVADHGEEFLEHGRKGHRKTLFEEVVRIPMILWVDGRRPERERVGSVVSLIDVFPTICELFSVECGYEGPGSSLLPYTQGDTPRSERNDALVELTTRRFDLDLVGLVRADGKVIRSNESGRTRYFDLREKEVERAAAPIRQERIEAYPARIREAVEELERRVAAASEAGRALHAGATGAKSEIDEATKRQLRELGYIE